MPLINSIPKGYKDGFKKLASLTDEQFLKIQQELAQSKLVSTIDDLLLSFNYSSELEIEYIEDIFRGIGSLFPIIDAKEVIDEVVEDIILLSKESEINLNGNVDAFRDRLKLLFNDEKIYYASKAEDLIEDYGNSFIECRIISDIRPVFDINLQHTPKAGVLVHNLTIHYQSNEEPYHKNISLLLTPADLFSLQEALDRAQKKEELLDSVFEKSGMKKLNA